ncbi:MAG: hypothetical protein LBO62_05445 [Endomicrobium sp.]|jgi:hypothetical protein|nr:hypothetical protein [Endomicrobium sp.]
MKIKILKVVIAATIIVLSARAAVFADEFDFLFNPVKISAAFINVYEANVKAGYIFNGSFYCNPQFGNSESSNLKTDNAFSFSAEFFKYISAYIAAGAGASYQIAGSFENLDGKTGFAPVYFALKLRSWPQQPGLYGYAVGQIGYNFFYSDEVFSKNSKIDGGGLYYALGFGIIYTNYIVECLYGVHSGKVFDLQNGSKEIDIELNKITLSLGYKF